MNWITKAPAPPSTNAPGPTNTTAQTNMRGNMSKSETVIFARSEIKKATKAAEGPSKPHTKAPTRAAFTLFGFRWLCTPTNVKA
jgi:hypothetical protein